jgi:hypothetical protein
MRVQAGTAAMDVIVRKKAKAADALLTVTIT